MILDPACEGFLGVSIPSSPMAELTGIVYVLQAVAVAAARLPMTVRTDCSYAKDVSRAYAERGPRRRW